MSAGSTSGQLDFSEEDQIEFVVAGGDSSEALEPSERAVAVKVSGQLLSTYGPISNHVFPEQHLGTGVCLSNIGAIRLGRLLSGHASNDVKRPAAVNRGTRGRERVIAVTAVSLNQASFGLYGSFASWPWETRACSHWRVDVAEWEWLAARSR